MAHSDITTKWDLYESPFSLLSDSTHFYIISILDLVPFMYLCKIWLKSDIIS